MCRCICHYGVQVMKFEPAPVIRPPRQYSQIFFDPLVTVLTGFALKSILITGCLIFQLHCCNRTEIFKSIIYVNSENH